MGVPDDVAERVWYALMALLASLYYGDEAAAKVSPVLARPSWASPAVLKILCNTKLQRSARAAILLCGVALAVGSRSQLLLRLTFAIAVAISDVAYWSGYGGHPGFILVYSSAAMVMPIGPHRYGTLRVIVAHQLGSSGLYKLRVGGLSGWLDPQTLSAILRSYLNAKAATKPHRLIEPQWLMRRALVRWLLRAPPALIGLLSCGALVIELIMIPVALTSSSPTLLALVALMGGAFHVGIALCTSIIFPFNLPVYLVALVPEAAINATCLLSPIALLAAAVLGLASFAGLEDWPLNAMVLFPYNHRQHRAIAQHYDWYRLALSDEVAVARTASTDPPLGPCLITKACNRDPAMFEPSVSRALLGESLDAFAPEPRVHRRDCNGKEKGVQPAEQLETRQHMLFHVLREHVRQHRPYVERRSFRCYDDLVLDNGLNRTDDAAITASQASGPHS